MYVCSRLLMISPCYYDCHIGCCISCSCSCSQRFSSFISLATLNLNDQWTETRDRAGWAESECEHLAPRARGKWVVSSVSVRVQSKEQHMRELLYPIIATFYYICKAHLTCGLCRDGGGLGNNIVKRCLRYMATWHTRAMIWIWILPPIIWALEEYIRSRNRITNNE